MTSAVTAELHRNKSIYWSLGEGYTVSRKGLGYTWERPGLGKLQKSPLCSTRDREAAWVGQPQASETVSVPAICASLKSHSRSPYLFHELPCYLIPTFPPCLLLWSSPLTLNSCALLAAQALFYLCFTLKPEYSSSMRKQIMPRMTSNYLPAWWSDPHSLLQPSPSRSTNVLSTLRPLPP